MLEYESQLMLDILDDSQLFVFAKGIPIEKVIANVFQIYGTEMNLVFVLSANHNEEAYFLDNKGKSRLFSITSQFNSRERREMYATGGVFFVTSRILIVDLLKDVVPIEKITGIIIFRGHNVVESSQEAFILRLYRTKNKTGFIKAFSHSPTSFLLGFSRVTNVMRACFLANLSLWPRFHSAIKEALKTQENSSSDIVTEIHLNLTEEMREIQSNLLDLVASTVGELKRLVPVLSDDDVTVETALTKSFDKIIRARVDPIWNTIDPKSREFLNDLQIFRLLLAKLTKADCVTFYSILCNYTSYEACIRSTSGWVLSKSADKIVTAAKRRLNSSKKEKKKSNSSSVTFDPEAHPKWLAVDEILREINKTLQEQEDSSEEDSPKISWFARSKTIVFAEDYKTCSAIRNYLTNGRVLTLAKIVRNCENIKVEIPAEIIMTLNSLSRNDKQDPSSVSGARSTSNTNEEKDVDEDELHVSKGPTEVQVTLTQIERKYEDIQFLQSPVFVLPLKQFGDSEPYGFSETLEKIRPDNIIIFDPDLELIRNIEIYRARFQLSQTIRIYFLVFHNSIEEQIYLTGIQREKMAFEKLIEEKTTMVVPNEREGKDELNQDLWRDPTKPSATNTSSGFSRRNMEKVDEGQQIILVDMREFRSELPSLIHKRGIDLEPLTLDVGDYILTPEICVERKSLSDLIGSLNSGRLYKQAEAMGRHYKKPVLLIEHEQKSGRYKNDLTQIMPKLLLLTMKFPNLRIIWSPGAHYSSEMFHELKIGKAQPDAEQAMSILKEAVGPHSVSKFNPVSHAILSKLPGVDSNNIYKIMNGVDSLKELCDLSLTELCGLLENSNAANLLHAALHTKLSAGQSEVGRSGLHKHPSTSKASFPK